MPPAPPRSLREAPNIVRVAFGNSAFHAVLMILFVCTLLFDMTVDDRNIAMAGTGIFCVLPLICWEGYMLYGHWNQKTVTWSLQKGFSWAILLLCGFTFWFILVPWFWGLILIALPYFFLHLNILRNWNHEAVRQWYRR